MLRSVLLVTLLGLASADLAAFLKGLKGKSSVEYAKVCESMGSTPGGYSMAGSTWKIQCTGQGEVIVNCMGKPFSCCSSPKAPSHKCTSCADKAWTCPASWTTGGSAPSDAPDAKAYIAAHNIYRCMHNVQAVQWDPDVHSSAKSWAQATGTTMKHSTAPSSYRKSSDGENLAGTFKFSKQPGVDATHMWYEEIVKDCQWKKSCFQSFSAGHFTAMMWKSISKVAYSDTTGKLAVGRYRGCDGFGPNFNNKYKTMVPPPVANWETCAAKVLACPTFKGLTEKNVEGCEASAKSGADGKLQMTYKTTCKKKYAAITSLISRYEIPEVFQTLAANPWPLAIACGSVFVLSIGVALRRSRARAVGVEDAALAEADSLE